MYHNTKLLKVIPFSLLAIVLLVLAGATILEKIFGTDYVNAHIYDSPAFAVLWGTLAVSSLLYMYRQKLQKHVPVALLHLSFLVILAGAFITWMWGEHGTLRMMKGEVAHSFQNDADAHRDFPFNVSLADFQIQYYEGTHAPMDFVSTLKIDDNRTNEIAYGEVSMNHILSYRGYRFCQSGYDEAGGTTLSISYDPCGIAVTYIGYALLLFSCLLVLFSKKGHFRQLLNNPLLKRGAAVFLFLVPSLFSLSAAGIPKVLPQTVAAKFGDLYVMYNNRVCPLETLAKDFTLKLYGNTSYRGFSPEQVFTGWLFYYSSWKEQPMIKIKSGTVRHALNIKDTYASLDDYIDEINQYKLDGLNARILSGEDVADRRGIEEANEKYNLISMLYSGTFLKIFPHRQLGAHTLDWYAQNDLLPKEMNEGEWLFIRKSFGYLQEMIVKKDFNGVSALLDKMKMYQRKMAGDTLPSDMAFRAEKLYNTCDYTKPLAMGCLVIGVLAFLFYCQTLGHQRPIDRRWTLGLNVLLIIPFLYLTLTIALRGYIGNHLPLSNGYETMQFMAWVTLILSFYLQQRFILILPFGFLLCGLALLVSMLGEANPQITKLMPVLASPLLSIHVVVIMVAYSLLAFVMLNGVAAFILRFTHKEYRESVECLQLISRIILYPAVFLLAIGIFVGAVWANVSWGRYWGWDPKEVWALITMLVYALALHPASLHYFRRPLFFHLFSIVAFLTVLITYFGVNFLLGGMHSYAG